MRMLGSEGLVMRFSILAVAVLGCAAVVEFGLRFFMPLPGGTFIHFPNTARRFEITEGIYQGISGAARYETNALGLRGDELAEGDGPRIVLLGGSAIESTLLDTSEEPAHRLQTLFRERYPSRRAWVANAGRSGHSTREHVLQSRVLVRSVPALDVLVVMAGVNDLLRRLAEDDRWRAADSTAPEFEDEYTKRAFALRSSRHDPERGWAWRTELGARVWMVARGLADAWRARRDGTLVADTRSVLRWRESRKSAARMRRDLPALDESLKEYRSNLQRIAEEVATAGVSPVLVTQPALWTADIDPKREELLWMGGVGEYQRPGGGSEYFTAAALAEGLSRYNAALLGVCADLHLQCVDLAALIPSDERAFYDDVHFNEEGARLVALAIADASREWSRLRFPER